MTMFEEMIAWAREYIVTPAERREQRRSFAYGNTHFENPLITREMIAEADRRLFPAPGENASKEG